MTDLPIEDIEMICYNRLMSKNILAVTNVSFGFLSYEADILFATRSGYLTEVEIKRSLSDLRADFNKKHKHDDERIKYFYYCVPRNILEECLVLIKKHNYDVTGVIAYNDNYTSRVINMGETKRQKTARKIDVYEMFQLARLGSFRIWSMKEKEFLKRRKAINGSFR